MRNQLCGMALLMTLSVGCATGPFARRDEVPAQHLSTQQVVDHLNYNARNVQSLQYDRVAIKVQQGLQTASVDGYLAYQKPRNFRLIAEAVGTRQADMGSNNDEFWFWIKRNDPPDLYHCSYEDLPNAREIAIPIHPDWIAEALGVTELGPPENYRIEEKGKTIELVSRTTSPQGEPMQKVTTIDRATGRIIRHDLIGPDGKPVWIAHVEEYQPSRVAGNQLIPRKVRLRCPSQRMEMHLKLDGCRINPLDPQDTHPQMFARPQVPGVRTIDLAGGRFRSSPTNYGRVRSQSY